MRRRMVTVNLYAAARASVGKSSMKVKSGTLRHIFKEIADKHPDIERVLQASSFLVNGLVSHDLDQEIAPASSIDVLPKFAGG